MSRRSKIDINYLKQINFGTLLTIVVPLVMGRDGNSVGDLADDVELLNADLVDLVQDVDAGDVGPVSFNHIDQLVRGGVASGIVK